MQRKQASINTATSLHAKPSALVSDLREMILSTRQTVAHGVNAALVMLHWQIGRRIHRDILNAKRAEYGEEIVATVSRQLNEEFGRGFAEKNLRRMMQFAEMFPESTDEGIEMRVSYRTGSK